jgi:hypothetical protein
VTEDELAESAVSKSVLKCFGLLTKFKSKKGGSKSKPSKKEVVADSKQKSILNYFK